MVAAAQRVRSGWELPPRPDSELRPHVNRGMPHLYAACFAEVGDTRQIQAAYEAEYEAGIADRTRLYAGMDEALAELKRLGTLACVTNKPEALARALLEALGIADRFAAVVGGDTCVAGKPDPVMLAAAEEFSGYIPSARGRCFMIGDTPGDIQLGRAFGAATIWCAWGYRDSPAPETPDLVADQPRSLPELVRSTL